MFKTVYEDKDVIVLDKPAGLITHPPKSGYHQKTLVDFLIKKYPSIKNVGDDPLRPGLVHRLDKDTSGLMVVAKNQKSFEYLKKQFQERKVEKHYLVLVHSHVKDKKGVITKSISLSKKGKRAALLDTKSKKAWTEYQVLKYYPIKDKDYTLLEVEPQTGRTHQIRVHLASIGHPVAGDTQYKFKRQVEPANLKRQFLHAAVLKFQLPDDKMIELKSPLPKDLKDVLL